MGCRQSNDVIETIPTLGEPLSEEDEKEANLLVDMAIDEVALEREFGPFKPYMKYSRKGNSSGKKNRHKK